MGRAGAGGGGSHSSGGHSSGRSSGGHSMGGSSSRAGSRSSSSGRSYSGGSSMPRGGGMGGPMPGPRPPRSPGFYGGGYYDRPPRRRRGSCLGTSITTIVIVMILILVFGVVIASNNNSYSTSQSTEVPASTYDREALTGTNFDNNCVIDEIGWVNNVSFVEKQLQNFFKETGIQPYVYFKAYDEALTTDSEKEEYANTWYEDNIDNEWTFLWMYFAEEDTDNDVGYMVYVNGYQVTSVMDAEAVEIFWAYVDNYWYSDLSTDDMIVKIFDSTADRIMQHTTTKNEIIRDVVIVIAIVVAAGVVIYIMKLRRKHEKERNEETERILNTPLE